MTSERSKRRDFLSLIFIAKSISKKLLIKMPSDWLSYYLAICYIPLVAKSAGFLAAKKD